MLVFQKQNNGMTPFGDVYSAHKTLSGGQLESPSTPLAERPLALAPTVQQNNTR